LDKDQKFRPKAKITRAEAAVMLYNAIEFVKKHGDSNVKPPEVNQDVTFEIVKVTDSVNKVVVSWNNAPNPGYSIAIREIKFDKSGTAVIRYELQLPPAGHFYPQVISKVSAETFVSSAYTIKIEQIQNGDQSVSSGKKRAAS